MEWHVRTAEPKDIEYLAKNLRIADVEEIYASSGRTPEESLGEAFRHPNHGIWVGVYKGNPEIIFGLTQTICDDVAVPWMVCTDKLKESPREFMSKCRNWVDGWNRKFRLLTNVVYAKNELHIKWLEWCGFELVEYIPEHGYTKEPFWLFKREQKD